MIHVRKQYNRWSFRLRALDNYIDAGESYPSEEEAGFAADLAKHYLRTFFHVTKNTEPSLDPEHFCTLAHRHNVVLPDRLSVEQNLAPGVRAFIEANRVSLDAFAEIHRPELREWEKLRNHPDEAVRNWCNRCDAASIRVSAFKAINHEYLNTLLLSAANRLNDAAGPLRRALKMHEHISDPLLVARYEELHRIRQEVEALSVVLDELATETANENRRAIETLTLLESNRPPLS